MTITCFIRYEIDPFKKIAVTRKGASLAFTCQISLQRPQNVRKQLLFL